MQSAPVRALSRLLTYEWISLATVTNEKRLPKQSFFSGVHFFPKVELDTMEPNSEESNSMVAISSPKTWSSHQYGNQQADYRLGTLSSEKKMSTHLK